MNKFSILLLFCSSFCFAQPNLLNAKAPSEIGKKSEEQIKQDNLTPLKYGYIDDRDVLFGKRIWEFIDIDERINFPLYYPTKPLMDRIPLFDVLRQYVESSDKSGIDISKFCFEDDYFSQPLDPVVTKSKFKDFKLTEEGETKVNTTLNPTKIDGAKEPEKFKKLCAQLIEDKQLKEGPDYKSAELNAEGVIGYKVQGYWYFDARLSEMKYRLLAIAPVATSAKSIVDATFGQQAIENQYTQMVADQNSELTEDQKKEKQVALDKYNEMQAPDILFWIYYPAIRDILKAHPAFNERNSSKPITFDDLLVARHFSGLIYKEENVYGDRKIEEYMKDNALNQLLESERVKEKIRNLEHDMWAY
ncbi:gliding motility protein GldN [Flavobacterium sp.]|jgi:gliding motility associated protien GldN|uniref:type IX secretion system ring protein PorN/GldN n=1 Tax=Flavobacterium sp. TaxID=239 RepID=UPI0038CF61F5